MKKNCLKILAVQGLLLVVIAIQNGCAPGHFGTNSGSNTFTSSSTCTPILRSGVQPVYEYLSGAKPISAASARFLSCSTCHFQGTTTAPSAYYFADKNFSNALNGFANVINVDANKIFSNAYNPQHYGGASPDNNVALDPLKQNYLAAASNYKTCVTQQNPGPGSVPVGTDYQSKKQTVAKTIPANQTAILNLQWDLGTEMSSAGDAVANGVFKISIQAITTSTGVKQYRLTAPAALGSTAKAILVRTLRVYLNGSLVSLEGGGSTWATLNNLAPANNATTGRTVAYPLPHGTGAMNLSVDTAVATNTIAIGFGEIIESNLYPNFNPTTYARLTAAANSTTLVPALNTAERVFAQRCQTCHNATTASGGVSLVTGANALQLLKLSGKVMPYLPEASVLHTRVTATTGFMPPGGSIPSEEIRWLRDWILDGAY